MDGTFENEQIPSTSEETRAKHKKKKKRRESRDSETESPRQSQFTTAQSQQSIYFTAPERPDDTSTSFEWTELASLEKKKKKNKKKKKEGTEEGTESQNTVFGTAVDFDQCVPCLGNETDTHKESKKKKKRRESSSSIGEEGHENTGKEEENKEEPETAHEDDELSQVTLEQRIKKKKKKQRKESSPERASQDDSAVMRLTENSASGPWLVIPVDDWREVDNSTNNSSQRVNDTSGTMKHTSDQTEEVQKPRVKKKKKKRRKESSPERDSPEVSVSNRLTGISGSGPWLDIPVDDWREANDLGNDSSQRVNDASGTMNHTSDQTEEVQEHKVKKKKKKRRKESSPERDSPEVSASNRLTGNSASGPWLDIPLDDWREADNSRKNSDQQANVASGTMNSRKDDLSDIRHWQGRRVYSPKKRRHMDVTLDSKVDGNNTEPDTYPNQSSKKKLRKDERQIHGMSDIEDNTGELLPGLITFETEGSHSQQIYDFEEDDKNNDPSDVSNRKDGTRSPDTIFSRLSGVNTSKDRTGSSEDMFSPVSSAGSEDILSPLPRVGTSKNRTPSGDGVSSPPGVSNKKVQSSDHVFSPLAKRIDETCQSPSRWTEAEDEQLKRNWNAYLKAHPIDNPYSLLNRGNASRALITEIKRRTRFYEKLSLNISRPQSGIMCRARRLFHPQKDNKIGKEYEGLVQLMHEGGEKWKVIGKAFNVPGQKANDTVRHIERVSKGEKKGEWREVEDELLIQAVINVTGTMDIRENVPWKDVAALVPTRNDRQCRSHWINALYWTAVCGRKRKIFMPKDFKHLVRAIKATKPEDEKSINWRQVDVIVEIDAPLPSYLKKWFEKLKKIYNVEGKPLVAMLDILSSRLEIEEFEDE